MILDERVRAVLAATTRFDDVRLMGETDSTNKVVAGHAADGASEGLVVAADVQTAGRGRLDRTWEAQPGAGLLVSVLLRPQNLPPKRWHLVTAAAGLAAQAACRDVADVAAEIKWPNDLLIADQKLAGILAEVAPGPHPPGLVAPAIVVGMGLNVHSGPPGSAVLDEAAGRRISRESLLVAWLTALDRLLGHWSDVANSYRRRCATIGRTVTVERLDGTDLTGVAEGVDEDGHLVVRVGTTVVVVSVGDVTHVRPTGAGPQG